MKTTAKAHIPPTPANRPIVEWQKHGDEYVLYTLSAEAAKTIRAVFDHRFGCYVAHMRLLPQVSSLDLREFRTEPTTDAFRAKLQRLYSRYAKMQAVLAKMQAEIDREEAKIVAELKRGGLRLKPGLLEDTQAMGAPKMRLHYCQSLYKYVDTEAVEKLADRYPTIKACIKTIKSEYLDEELLAEALEDLPSSVQRAVYKFDVQASLRETPLKRPECVHCGGRLSKQSVCKHCGLES